VCGGSDGNAPLASCEVLDAASFALQRTIPLAAPRTGHTAITLETGAVLLVGGTGDNGAPLSSIEYYTP
jgi:hypothetical protein